ncbi:MAG: hypothetical protein ACKVVP_14750 [Chloroflexota bacterium]
MSSQAMTSFNDRVALREGLSLISRVIKLQSAVIWFFRGAALGLLADCLLLVVMRMTPLGLQLSWLVLPPAALGVLGLITAFIWPIPIEQVARRADTRLGLKERLITAIELQRTREAHPLAGLQLHDAVEHVRQIEALDAFPVRLPVRELQMIGVLGVIAALLVAAPNPMERTVREREQIQQAVRQEAERLNRLADQVAASNLDDPVEELSQLEQELREGSRLLNERSSSGEEAMAALASIEQKILGSQGGGGDELDDALSSLAGSLALDPNTRQLATALARGDYKQSAEELKKLAERVPEMSAADRSRLARSMRTAGNRASRSNPALGRSLAQGGDALEDPNGDPSSALGDAANQLGAASGQLRASGQRDRALSQIQQSRSAVSRALQAARGRQTPGLQSPGQRGAEGQASDLGGSGGEFDDEMGGDRPGGSNAGTGPGSRTETVYDPLFSSGREDFIPGGDGFDPGEVYAGSSLDDAYRNDAQVGYSSVYANYQEKATQSLQNSYIPAGLKDLVKDYFSSLAPSTK